MAIKLQNDDSPVDIHMAEENPVLDRFYRGKFA
jgi:hypothetical protein